MGERDVMVVLRRLDARGENGASGEADDGSWAADHAAELKACVERRLVVCWPDGRWRLSLAGASMVVGDA